VALAALRRGEQPRDPGARRLRLHARLRVEQFFRDNRLNAIHEGTNGIQALDLLGRKVFGAHGESLGLLEREVEATIAAAAGAGEELAAHAAALGQAWHELIETTRILGTELRRDARRALGNAHPYLEAFGHTVVAWLWLRQALAAQRGLAAGGPDADFYRGKLAAARYFFRWELPATAPRHALLRSLDATCLEAEEAWF
jgi:butyryl-CoA dehydrogenase